MTYEMKNGGKSLNLRQKLQFETPTNWICNAKIGSKFQVRKNAFETKLQKGKQNMLTNMYKKHYSAWNQKILVWFVFERQKGLKIVKMAANITIKRKKKAKNCLETLK